MKLASDQMDRACGVLLGQACGDALGVPYEFATPPAAGELARMSGGGLGNYAPGEWSDDTQMAACIALVSATGADLTDPEILDDIADNFLRWQREGATDIGIQTSSVLGAARHGDASPSARLATAARGYADRHPRSAGNGALMRTSVVGLTALDDRDRTARSARLVAELTHADPLAGDSAVLWSEAVRVAVVEKRLDLAGGLDLIPEERRGQWAAWIDQAETEPMSTFTPNGFTVTALQAAWAAIVQTPVPEDAPERASYPCLHLQHALHNAVRIGNDTDTVAAIAGGPARGLLGSVRGPAHLGPHGARLAEPARSGPGPARRPHGHRRPQRPQRLARGRALRLRLPRHPGRAAPAGRRRVPRHREHQRARRHRDRVALPPRHARRAARRRRARQPRRGPAARQRAPRGEPEPGLHPRGHRGRDRRAACTRATGSSCTASRPSNAHRPWVSPTRSTSAQLRRRLGG